MGKAKMRLLVLGPRYHNDGQTGGVVVLFELFLEELKRNNVSFQVVDTNKSNYSDRFTAIISIFISFVRKAPSATHVSLHGTANDYVYVAPPVTLMSKWMKKHVSLRKFAGNFKEYYEGLGFFRKTVMRHVLRRSDTIFFETRYLVKYFKRFNSKTSWFPNVRKQPSGIHNDTVYKKNLIFLGHVSREKGVLELIEAADRLPDDYNMDIYGQLTEPDLEAKISSSQATYKGVLKSHEVAEIMSGYDVLVLPTCWKGEGYPSVIIEAFSVGVPVVATALEGISEIVVHKDNGLLVEPRNVRQLVDAIQWFSKENYPAFSINAEKSFEEFNSAVVTKRFLEAINASGIN